MEAAEATAINRTRFPSVRRRSSPATWNLAKGRGARGTDAENSAFLSQVQTKLRDQAKSLSNRMKARQLEDAGDSFKSFVEDMDQAVAAMDPAPVS
ncbi:MAG: hypothetical protein WDO73_15580 [Ignavibacteriota bacterium]